MAKVDMPMPQMGESITEGTIIRWLKKEGENVERDEIIVEISTDKVDSEIPAPFSGKLLHILASDGETVEVGTAIASIETDGGDDAQPAVAAPVEDEVAAPQESPPAAAEPVESPPPSEPAATPAQPTSGAQVELVMPQMGEGITEGTVIRWLKAQGDAIERDEIIIEISTDKVDSEIPSPHAGVIAEMLVAEGETVQVGTVIARIDSAGTAQAAASEKVGAASAPPAVEEVTVAPASEATGPAPTPAKSVKSRDGRRFYSPLVRSIAAAEGVSHEELVKIDGTGALGRVTKKDILNYLESRSAGTPSTLPAQPVVQASRPGVGSGERVEVIPMNTMRKSIARHMVASVQTSPHVFMMTEADMTDLVAYRSQNKDAFLERTGTKLTYMPFIVSACVKALRDYPMVNSSIDGDNMVLKKYINVGIAVALENSGLIVPVVKNADELNVVGLARAINDLAQRARSKKLKPDEVQDGTFSITNMGSFGSLLGFPIINQPQVAILGMGTIQKRPVVVNDAIAIKSMLYLTLSFDHRLVDGALAGQFLEQVAGYLTNFDTSTIM